MNKVEKISVATTFKEDETISDNIINTFCNSSPWMFVWNGNISGGKNWEDGNSKLSNTYSVDLNASPMTMDLIVRVIETNEEKKMLGIFEFVAEDLIKIQFSLSEQRPDKFSEGHDENKNLLKRSKIN